MSEQRSCRIRIVFAKGDPVKFISHLDLLRAWERMLCRSGLPVAYSQGFHPHPKITIALPLPVGCTGGSEVLDVIFGEPLPAERVMTSLEPVVPEGIWVISAQEVPLKGPAMPTLVRRARYQMTLAGIDENHVRRRVSELMERDRVQVEFRRKTFDLRPLVSSLSLRSEGVDAVTLEAELLRDAGGRIGRPDVLLQVLGLSEHVRRVHRTQIVFDAPHA